MAKTNDDDGGACCEEEIRTIIGISDIVLLAANMMRAAPMPQKIPQLCKLTWLACTLLCLLAVLDGNSEIMNLLETDSLGCSSIIGNSSKIALPS